MDHSLEALIGLVGAHGNTLELLEHAEEVLDQMAPFVHFGVDLERAGAARMYLREMGSVELLSREGEIAIAKRIEAGRDMMIGGICENPLTVRALLLWRDALNENKMLLRDIIDLDATYGSALIDEAEAEMAKVAAGDVDGADGDGD